MNTSKRNRTTGAAAKRGVFAAAVFAGHSGKDAAIQAGYSVATAATAACRLLKHPGVQAELTRMRAQAAATEPQYKTPLEFLVAIASGRTYALRLRVRAAIALLPYYHARN